MKSKIKNAKTKFYGVPRFLDRENIFSEIAENVNIDEDQLKIALADDKLCAKFAKGYYSTIDECEDEDEEAEALYNFAGEFCEGNNKLKKLIIANDED